MNIAIESLIRKYDRTYKQVNKQNIQKEERKGFLEHYSESINYKVFKTLNNEEPYCSKARLSALKLFCTYY